MGHHIQNRTWALRAAMALAVLGAMPATGARADKIKADNALPLNDPASWTADTSVPGAGETAVFDGTLVTNHTFDLGDDLQSWGGIVVSAPAAVAIDAGHMLTLGAGGISMAATASLFSFASNVALAAPQTWSTSTALSVSGSINLGSNVLVIQGSGQVDLSLQNVISGGGTLTHAGTGALYLGSANYAGSIVQLGGVTYFGAFSAGAASVTLTGGTLALQGPSPFSNAVFANGNAAIVENSNTPTLTLSSGFSGGGTVRYQFSGTVLLGSTAGQFSGFSGLLSFGSSSGTVRATGGVDEALGNATLDLGSGTLVYSTLLGSVQSIGALSGGIASSLRGADNVSPTTTYVIGGVNRTTTFSGSILDGAGSGVAITKVGTGTLTLTGTASAYSGSVQVQNGVLMTSTLAALGNGTDAIVLGTSTTAGMWQYTGTTATTSRTFAIASAGSIDASGVSGSLTLSSTGSVSYITSNTPRTLTLSGSNTNVNTFALKLPDNGAGSASLVKNGSGTWLVSSGTSTFTGGTSINGGVLLTSNVAGKTPLGAGVVNVNAGGAFGGTGVTTERVFVNVGGHIQPGIYAGPGAVSDEGTMHVQDLSLASGSMLDFDIDPVLGTNDLVAFLSGGSLDLASAVAVNLFRSGTSAPPATSGSYILLSNLNFSTQFSGSLESLRVGDPLPSQNYQFSIVNTATDGTGNLVLNISDVAGKTSGTWNGGTPATNTNWAAAGNWVGGIPGGNAGDSAVLGPLGAGGTVSLNGDRRLGYLFLAKTGNGNSFSLMSGSGGRLFLDNGTGAANMVVASGNHLLAADLELDSDTVVTFQSASTLSVSGVLSSRTDGTAVSLSVIGGGSLLLSGGVGISGCVHVPSGYLEFSGNGMHSVGAVSFGGVLQVDAGTTLISDGVNGTGNWTIAGTQQIRANGSTQGAIKVSSLSLTGAGNVDITNNLLVVEPTGGKVISQTSQILSEVASGGITSSTIALTPGTQIAVVDNSDYPTPKTEMRGELLDGNSIIVVQALQGDADLSGTVDFADFTTLLQSYNAPQASRGWVQGNSTGQGAFADLTALLQNYNHGLESFNVSPGEAAGSTAPVPEPASAAVLAVIAPMLLKRRKRCGCRSGPIWLRRPLPPV